LSIELDLNVRTGSCQGRPVATSLVKEHTVRRITNSTYISLDGSSRTAADTAADKHGAELRSARN
jgi:hypothetical protein